MNHLTLSPALGWPVGGAVAAPLRRSYCMSVAALTATKPFGHAFGAYCFV